MAINTNALALGASIPAKAAHPAESHADGGQGAATGAAASGASQNGTGTGATDASVSPSTRPKTTGPSARTRGNARAHSRSNAAASAGGPSGTDPQDVAPESSGDFGSVMASALGRSTAATRGAAAPAADTTDSATPATSGQPASGTPADAVAWIAQALMPATASAPALDAAPDTTGAAAPAAALTGLPLNTASASGQVQTPGGLAAQAATQAEFAAAMAARGTAEANRSVNADPAPQLQAVPDSTAQPAAASAAAPGNITALADVQQLISGLTATKAAAIDAGTDSAAPPAHAAATDDSTDAAQAAALVQAGALGRANSSLGATTLTIHAPVGSAAFADQVSARVTDLAQSGISQAQLQLNPADMGPVQVHITMQAGQASVWFGAAHADTRAALEQSLPRLRELFAGAGMPLTDSGVFREPPQQQQAQSPSATGSVRATQAEAPLAASVTSVATIRLSLLDTYA